MRECASACARSRLLLFNCTLILSHTVSGGVLSIDCGRRCRQLVDYHRLSCAVIKLRLPMCGELGWGIFFVRLQIDRQTHN